MSPPVADLVFRNGPVHTLDAAGTVAGAIAVRHGRIIAVGDDSDVSPLVGAGTDVVDLRGRALLPGFQDAHVHPIHAGLAMTQCDLHEVWDLAEALTVIGRYAGANLDATWIAGGGWSMEWFPGGTPSRQLLDAIVPDRPAYLVNRDGHGAWVNSMALKQCGIDAGTQDPADGRIEREVDGTPQGTLHEGAALLVHRHIPEPTADALVHALRLGQQRLHSVGITAWQDAMVKPPVLRAYLTAADTGLLTGRVVGALWWDRDRGEEQLPELIEQRLQVGRFRTTTVKIMQDGVAENFTAAMTSSYLDSCGCRTGNRGISFVQPNQLRSHVIRLDAEGFQVHIHAIGDRAVREALDAFAAARAANGMTDHRHHIAHLQVVHPDDVPRFAALGVSANIQPLWAVHEPQMDVLTIPFLDPALAGWQYPFGDLHRAGASLVAGSDWPVSSPDPFLCLHAAVHRRLPGGGARAFLPEQRLDLMTAVRAYTIGSARVNHLDSQTGTIELGKAADLVVADQDPFAIQLDELAGVSVVATYVDGDRVYADPVF